MPFTHLAHADWSKAPQGRWCACAARVDGRWRASGPAPVGEIARFVERLFAQGSSASVLAGFDFPIGLPALYARETGLTDFREALDTFGTGEWVRFYDVAETRDDIGVHRPFYPMRAATRGTVARRHLVAGHRAAAFEDLARRCERRTSTGGRAAGVMFWTLGAAAVGKAALHGWREVVGPARRRGARIWPFDGDLWQFADEPGVTVAETYPGDAYGQIGLPQRGWSKTNREHRRVFAAPLLTWAESHGVELDRDLLAAIHAGFAPEHGVDNGFDAVVGLFAMIAVADGRRRDGAPVDETIRRWEGWILGRHA